MPVVLVTCLIRLMTGPCYVGDEQSDEDLMKALGATLGQQPGNHFKEWRSEEPPRVVLNKLDALGYKVISSTGIGQTCIWTCYKP
ncbi:GTP cyclohydrolase 1 feedback regulatory protein-like [Watersipora subatra]|uniref:GTP cyclohydrolase 1 feedback regulatory protein-like n=1 Tax=Watersipora subatra TaxID=2589382 RepID=UPI00355C2D08